MVLCCAGPSALGRAANAIQSAVHHGRTRARVPATALTRQLVEAMKKEGYVHTAVELPPQEGDPKLKRMLLLNLSEALNKIKSVTTPGRNGTQYGGLPHCGLPNAPQSNGLRTYFVKTARGIMSQNEAQRLGIRAKVVPLCWVE